MKYFKDKNTGQVYAYDQEQIDGGWVKAVLVPMTDEEVSAHLAPLPPTPEKIIETMRTAIQAHMDAAAQGYGYDDIKAAVTYADEPAVPKFQAEGRAFRAWRSLVWAHAYEVLDAVQVGAREQPTADELLAELPELVIE